MNRSLPDDATGDDVAGHVTGTYAALAGEWDTSGAAWNQPVAARLVELARLTPPMRVLDAGCGAGAATIAAARAVTPGGQVTGIDVAAPMLDRARREAVAAGLASVVSFERADAADPPFAPASLDAVLASMLVYLLPDPAAALARWRDLLRPGGVLGFSWVVAEDPAWDPVYAAVDAFVPDGREGWRAFTRRRPWGSGSTAARRLPARLSSVTTTAEPVVTRYDSPRHWWASSWTQAPRLTWQHIPPDRREAARDAAFGLLEDLRQPGRTLARTRTVGYIAART
jgi:SAM-dependent methyltransferase